MILVTSPESEAQSEAAGSEPDPGSGSVAQRPITQSLTGRLCPLAAWQSLRLALLWSEAYRGKQMAR